MSKTKDNVFERKFQVPLFVGTLHVAMADDLNDYLRKQGIATETFPADAIATHSGTNIGICFLRGAKSPINGLVAHEASHAVDMIFERMGEHSPGGETRAYLLEWVVNKCHEVIEKNRECKNSSAKS